jgi:hypothetical protein
MDVYRQKIRDDLPGIEGDEVARKKIEEYANQIRPPGFLVSLVPLAFWNRSQKSSLGPHQNTFCGSRRLRASLV